MPPPTVVDHGDGVLEIRTLARGTTKTEVTLYGTLIATIRITAKMNIEIKNLGGCRNLIVPVLLTGVNDGITICPNGGMKSPGFTPFLSFLPSFVFTFLVSSFPFPLLSVHSFIQV